MSFSFHHTKKAKKSEIIYNWYKFRRSFPSAPRLRPLALFSSLKIIGKNCKLVKRKKFLFPKVNMKAYICILIPLNILANAGL
jgi:hypothetical protein